MFEVNSLIGSTYKNGGPVKGLRRDSPLEIDTCCELTDTCIVGLG